MKSIKAAALIFGLSMLLSGCMRTVSDAAPVPSTKETAAVSEPTRETGTDGNAQPSDPIQERLEKRCGEIASLYYDLYANAEKTEPQNRWEDPVLAQGIIDAIETRLIAAGYDVMDTNGAYPGYLATADNFHTFLERVQQKVPADQEVLTILESGALSYRLFSYDGTVATLYSMGYSLQDTEPYYEKHVIQDWELTDRGNFYYRIYPADDKHYDDFSLIRLNPPDLELYDMNLRYILPVGYLATNIFLHDWTESDWGNLSFNDMWEYLYASAYGEQYLPNYDTLIAGKGCCKIPAADFETVVMPYFNIDLETFRQMAQYDAEGDYYPWRPLESIDLVSLWYYACTPEVVAYQNNPDGTITITVDMLSTDLKTDRLFSHEVTIRPLENGRFQYVGNKVTYQTEYGLPYAVPRLLWG